MPLQHFLILMRIASNCHALASWILKFMYSKYFFLFFRHGWLAGLEQIKLPHVKYICPNAWVCFSIFINFLFTIAMTIIHTKTCIILDQIPKFLWILEQWCHHGKSSSLFFFQTFWIYLFMLIVINWEKRIDFCFLVIRLFVMGILNVIYSFI